MYHKPMGTHSYGIDFFDDSTLETLTANLLRRVENAKTQNNPHKNVIDPFAAVFEAAASKIRLDEWFPTEVTRQVNKALSNALGDFHQEAIGNLPGWSTTGASGGVVDLEHPAPFGVNQKPAFAEVKNKFNTMSSSTQEALYDRFQGALGWPQFRDSNFYLIQVIQRRASGDVPWAPAKRGKRDDIRVIGASQVYELATGDPDAFRKLHRAIVSLLTAKHGFDANQPSITLAEDLLKRATRV